LTYSNSEVFLKFRQFPILVEIGEGGNAISSKILVRILGKKQTKGNQKRLINKLKKQQKLTNDEFWLIYDSIWQKGPQVKYQNPDKWIDTV